MRFLVTVSCSLFPVPCLPREANLSLQRFASDRAVRKYISEPALTTVTFQDC